ncbi:MAG: hypothetical protein Q7T66_09685 [Herminiimonas sp.]|uniref:hypothetical protein n=1 Tax=Herminiimonas sp. TaxID=1926289 RepID=UPI00271A4B13|nr:hypothetical protein [Herminiimonas sp.]MDO9420921.1 hypothetical protein [Herminiimonas sp.]
MQRLLMIVLWPSFLVAIAAEGAMFALIDPLHGPMMEGSEVIWSLATYTLGFFLLWLFCALSSALTCYLGLDPQEVE